MAMRGPRQQVGSAAWVAEERASASQIARSEADEFTYSVRNELDWLNEHMNGIFDENQQNLVDVFKTPGKLRGRTPHTARKLNLIEARVPLSDIFSATPKGAPSPFTNAIIAQSQTPKLMVAHDEPRPAPAPSPRRAPSPSKPVAATAAYSSPKPVATAPPPKLALVDSGYHGSQSQDAMDVDEDLDETDNTHEESNWEVYPETDEDVPHVASPELGQRPSQTQATGDASFHSAKEEQTKVTKAVAPEPASEPAPESPAQSNSPIRAHSPLRSPTPVCSPRPTSPYKSSPLKPVSPQKSLAGHSSPIIARKPVPAAAAVSSQPAEPQPTSDGSSPIRPVVRKSSMNFASLPAREPLGGTKSSIGARMSRVSHLDQARHSYYNRPTGGKSLGNARQEDEDHDEMDIDDETTVQNTTDMESKMAAHNKTYTQLLQDQISALGKSQSTGSRPSRSMASMNILSQSGPLRASQSAQPPQPAVEQLTSSTKKDHLTATPGAFPDDDEDDDDEWIAPPAKKQAVAHPSPRPVLSKSYTADVMEGILGKDSISGSEFAPSRQHQAVSREASPKRAPAHDRLMGTMGHAKSSSVPFLPSNAGIETEGYERLDLKKVSVSNPAALALATVHEGSRPVSPNAKSPSRSFRESPLKQVKNKLSSMFKNAKVLNAGAAAASAGGKAALLSSPSTNRLGYHAGPSVESLAPVYPDLGQHMRVASQDVPRPASPVRNPTRKTRASVEREKREQKQKEKEAKEAQLKADEDDRLAKARNKEREKARAFNKEQERVAALERQMAQKEQERIERAAREQERELELQRQREHELELQRERERQAQLQQEQERLVAARQKAEAQQRLHEQMEQERMEQERMEQERMEQQRMEQQRMEQQRMEQEARKRPASPVKETPRPAKGSPRKGKAPAEAFDRDVEMSDAPSMMPPPSVTRSAIQPKSTVRRPVKPSKETSKTAQARTVIRVNPLSQHSQMHPSTSVLAATLQDTLGPQPPQSQLKPKASAASLKTKKSHQSLKSSVSSVGRPKALEAAAKRKEQEEREAQRKLEAKQELERKKEQQRRQEAERQKEEERRQAAAQAEAKKAAQRQAIEKAKQTRAPPPPQRSQQSGRPDYGASGGSIPRPPSRMDELSRPNAPGTASAVKPASKRPLQQDDERYMAQPSQKGKEAKRIRLTEEFDYDELEMGGVITSQPSMMAPPVRPSGGFKKDLPTKTSLFPKGYTNAQAQSGPRDVFKTPGTMHGQAKAGYPDMSQLAKGPIPFAQNPNQPGPSNQHKTPARTAMANAAKSAGKGTRSSPRFQNGESIELPDIQTDDEDSDEDEGRQGPVADWVDSPELRKALMRQESVDPMMVFGPPAPLNMEEVFSKNKERWGKFRARSSSANWSGADKLTEEDIRKDLIAREKIRQEGGWSYELSRDLA